MKLKFIYILARIDTSRLKYLEIGSQLSSYDKCSSYCDLVSTFINKCSSLTDLNVCVSLSTAIGRMDAQILEHASAEFEVELVE